jgi:hypothetical protein
MEHLGEYPAWLAFTNERFPAVPAYGSGGSGRSAGLRQTFSKTDKRIFCCRMSPAVVIQNGSYIGPESIMGVGTPPELKPFHMEECIEGNFPLGDIQERFYPRDEPFHRLDLPEQPVRIPPQDVHQHTLAFIVKVKAEGEAGRPIPTCGPVQKLPPEDSAEGAGETVPPVSDNLIEGDPELFAEGRGEVLNAQPSGDLCSDPAIPVIPYPFIDGDGKEADISPFSQQL